MFFLTLEIILSESYFFLTCFFLVAAQVKSLSGDVEWGTIGHGCNIGFELEAKTTCLSSNEVKVQRLYNVNRGHN